MSMTKAKKPPVQMQDCRACAEPIIFVRLNTGKALPCNPLPYPSGNVAARMHMGRLIGFVISEEHKPGPLDDYRLVPHFATCEELKRKRRAEKAPVEQEEPLW